MKIIEGKYNGFCFGVQTAVEAVEKALDEHGVVYTLGPVIHNKQVVEALSKQGAVVIESVDDIPSECVVVIRSHGAPPEVYQKCKEKGVRIIDATCPFVARTQRIVEKRFKEGFEIIIAGEAAHPEVIGIAGVCGGKAHIVSDKSQALALPEFEKAFLVAQTTLNPFVFEEISNTLKTKCRELVIENTICNSTLERLGEAERLSKVCDAMLVIGGRNSSNTAKLFEICRNNCKNTYLIESEQDVFVENIALDGIIGIVAGASTPQWSIREVITSMYQDEQELVSSNEDCAMDGVAAQSEEQSAQADSTQEDFKQEASDTVQDTETQQNVTKTLSPEEKFQRDLEKTMVRIRPGQVKKGTIVQIVGDDVYVNIGYKSDGIIPQSELSLDEKSSAGELFNIGDEIMVEIIKINDGEGNVLLSRKRIEQRNREKQMVAELEDGRHFDVHIKKSVKGGLLSQYHSARVFIPASQVSDKYVENLEEFVGKKLTVKVVEMDKSKKRIVASHRAVLKDQEIAALKEKYKSFTPGQKVKGIIRRITDFGAFADIGGIDGLIHVSDLSWNRVKHPSDVVKVGDEVEVEILSVNPEAERIGLGYKQLQPKPWDTALERYLPGDIVEGRVDRIAPFGAFVELEPGLHGLVHISQVATRRIEKVEDELRVGDVITIKVLEVNPETKRISLSRRAVLQANKPEYIPEKEKEPVVNIPPVKEAKVSLKDIFSELDLK